MSRLTDEQIKKITAQVISCCCKEPVTTPLVQCCGGTFFVRNRYDEWAYLDGQEFTPAQNAPCSVSLSNYAPSQYPCVDLYEWLDSDLYYKEANCLGSAKTKLASGGQAAFGGNYNSEYQYYLWTAETDLPDYINGGGNYNTKLFFKGQEIYSGTFNNSDYSGLGNAYAFIKTNGGYAYKVFYNGQLVADKVFDSHIPNSSACSITAGLGSSIFIDGTEYEHSMGPYGNCGTLYYYKDTGNNAVRKLYFNGQQIDEFTPGYGNCPTLPEMSMDMFRCIAHFDVVTTGGSGRAKDEYYFNGVKCGTKNSYAIIYNISGGIDVFYGGVLAEHIDTSDTGSHWNGGNSYTYIYYNTDIYSSPKTITRYIETFDYDTGQSSSSTDVIGSYTDDPDVSMPQIINSNSCCYYQSGNSSDKPLLIKKDGAWCVPVFHGGGAWTFQEISDGSNDVTLCCSDRLSGSIIDKTQKMLFDKDGSQIGSALTADFSDSKPEYLPGGRTSIGCCGQTRLYRPTETEQLIDVETYEAGLMKFNIDTWERLDNAV